MVTILITVLILPLIRHSAGPATPYGLGLLPERRSEP